ncbi:MAG: hypothetical protein EAZ89_16960 [Bacteroidetes bacterium]|nr:MAG: hypothetical protein EAZ89_16960 [Bacteroidota bacterium]
MINLYLIFLTGASAWFLFSPRKETPAFILLHALTQYVFTLALWMSAMDSFFGSLLLGFIVLASFLLIWARSLNYSQELLSVRMFFSVSQWAILLTIVLFAVFKEPYVLQAAPGNDMPDIRLPRVSLHPLIKLSGNLLLFTTFFQVIISWGQRWSYRKSLFDLGPLWLYFFLLGLLRILHQMQAGQFFA